MLLPKSKFREAVLQILYSWEISKTEEDDLLSLLMEQLKTTKKNMREAWDRAEVIWEKKELVDERIRSVSHAYDFDRISKVDLAILRLSSFEMLFDTEISTAVAIAEAIRLSRKFSSPEASEFVQAILNGVLNYEPAVQ